MSVASRARGLWTNLVRRRGANEALDEELRAYLELVAADHVRAGLSPGAARRKAFAEMGGVEATKENVRDARAGAALDTLARDVRQGARALRRAPLFTTVAVLTLALGLGANTAIFSIVDAALLRPVSGVRAPEELVAFERVQPTDVFDNFGYPDYVDYRDRTRTLSSVAAYASAMLNLGTAAAERVRGNLVSGNYFSTLGVHAALGRTLRPTDDGAPGASPVAVLGNDLWRRAFGGDRRVIGRTITLNGAPYTVVGVAPRGFRGTATGLSTDVWVPLAMQPQAMPSLSAGALTMRAWGWIEVFGRLAPGVSVHRADVEVRGIARQLELAYPETNAGRTVTLVRGIGMYPDTRAEIHGPLALLFGAVVLLLLLACANVAGLLLVRAAVRQREMAARLALGAGRARLVRQLLTEGLLLAALAGAVGLGIALAITRFARSLVPASPALRQLDVTLDWRVAAFTLAVTLCTGVVLTLFPALRASQVSPVSVLKSGTSGAGRRRPLAQRALVAAQVAISLVLLVAGGVVLATLRRLLTENPGFETRHVAMASVDLTMQGYSPERGRELVREIVDRLNATPGIQAATLAQSVPPHDVSSREAIFHPGEEPPQEVLRGHWFELGLHVDRNSVAPRYFHTLGITLVRGRDFTPQDGPDAPGVAIVSEQLARRFWPGEDAIGKRLSLPTLVGPPRAPLEVIGIAADHYSRTLTSDPPLILYLPLLQNYDGRTTISVRSADPAAALGDMRRTVSALDPALPLFDAQTMQEHVAASLWEQRVAASWTGAFGVLALVLAGLGLYGVVAQSVTQRARELSIRLALGAEPARVARLVVREGMWLAAVGLAAGVPAAMLGTRMVRGAVSGATGMGPLWVVAIGFVLGAVILVACYVPARRAARANPVDALRCE